MDHQHIARSEKVPTKDVNEAVQKACQRGNYAEAVEELDSGYLRSGRVLLQNKQIIQAMKMYERGIQKVSADDPGLQVT
ncbi:MAG: hypothetical protein M1824_003647 [Vezdaea acicularis]|nr:MAG: hypothetical protein M1824_003647 [Vezdaea acicularis]